MKRKVVSLIVFFALLIGLPSAAIAEVKGNGLFQGFPIVNLKIDGKAVESDVPAINFNGRTLVPFRAIGDAIGARVGWDSETQTASLDTPDLGAKIEVLEALFDAVKPSATGGAVAPSAIQAGVNKVKIVGWGLPVKNTDMGVILVREGSLQGPDGKDLPTGALTVAPNGALLQDTGSPKRRTTRWGELSRRFPDANHMSTLGDIHMLGKIHVDEQGRFAGEFRCVGRLHVWLVPVWEWVGFTGPPWEQPTPTKTAFVDLATLAVDPSPHLVVSGGTSSYLLARPVCVVDDTFTALGLLAYGLTPGTSVVFRVDGQLIGNLYCDAEEGVDILFYLQGEFPRVYGVKGMPAEQLFCWAKDTPHDKVVPVPLDKAYNSRADAGGMAFASANLPVYSPRTSNRMTPFSVGFHEVELFLSGSTVPIASATFEVRPQSPTTASLDRQVEWHADGRLTYKGQLHVSGLWPNHEASISITSGQMPSPDGTLTFSFVFENINKARFPMSAQVSQEGRQGVQISIDLPEGP